MATPFATRPATSVQPPTATWRPVAPAHTSAFATGAMASGATAIAVNVNSAAASFFIAYVPLLVPTQSSLLTRAQICGGVSERLRTRHPARGVDELGWHVERERPLRHPREHLLRERGLVVQ